MVDRAARFAALVLAPLAAACAPEVRVDGPGLERARPATVAVLPFAPPPGEDPDGLLARKAAAVRAAVARQVALGPCRALPPAEVDAALARAGIEPGAAHRASYQRLARALGVDALLRGQVTSLTNVEGVVLFFHTVAAELRLVDARSGAVLADVVHAERALGGFLPESQQAVRAILTTVENSTDAGFLRLAERFAEGAVRALPLLAPPRPAPPTIEDVRVEAPDRPLVPGDAVRLEVRTGPGLHVTADLGPDLRGIPLAEVAPGRYLGVHLVGPGEAGAAAPAVRARDRFGDGTWRLAREAPLVLAARPPAAPRGAVLAVDAAGRPRAAWRAVPGAARYRVFALDARGRPRALADVEEVFAPVPPDARRLAVAAVDARGQVGPLAVLEARRGAGARDGSAALARVAAATAGAAP